MLSISLGVKIYRKFYSEEKEKSNGVVGISISRPVFQPSTAMGSVLSVRYFFFTYFRVIADFVPDRRTT